MGVQIIKQPDGKLAVFCRSSNEFVVWDAPAREVLDWFAEDAAKQARQSALIKIEQIACGKRPYAQFTLSWEEAVELAEEDPRIHIACEDLAVECECGTIWPDGVFGKGHDDMECEGDR